MKILDQLKEIVGAKKSDPPNEQIVITPKPETRVKVPMLFFKHQQPIGKIIDGIKITKFAGMKLRKYGKNYRKVYVYEFEKIYTFK